MIPLVKDTINKSEIDRLIEWLKTYPHLTKGELTLEYEKKWSESLGCRYSVFVNSGSSANLLMLYSLIESGKINRGDKVIVPAVSWSTDLAPVVQFGLEPVLCDCNLDDLSVDLAHLEKIISTQNPKVLLLVSVLGLVPDMEKISNLCRDHGVILLEDACESLGSKFNDKSIGTFGLMSSFSTYFGHHLSTIEGGMICTNDKDTFNMLKSLRSHGWDRDMDVEYQNYLRQKYDVTEFESLYKFYNYGFNVRATDLQAFLGLDQLKKLELIVNERHKNYNLYREHLENSFWMPPKSTSDRYISNFAYPVLVPNRSQVVDELKRRQIAVRPLISGSHGRQPFWIRKNGVTNLKNADLINDNGMYLPNNHELTEEDIRSICHVIKKYIH